MTIGAASSWDKRRLVHSVIVMTKSGNAEDSKKREKIQEHFWNEVGSIEHISLPKMKNAVRKEFSYKNEKSVQEQIRLMQTEGRIRIESRVKVWIRPPHTSSSHRELVDK